MTLLSSICFRVGSKVPNLKIGVSCVQSTISKWIIWKTTNQIRILTFLVTSCQECILTDLRLIPFLIHLHLCFTLSRGPIRKMHQFLHLSPHGRRFNHLILLFFQIINGFSLPRWFRLWGSTGSSILNSYSVHLNTNIELNLLTSLILFLILQWFWTVPGWLGLIER